MALAEEVEYPQGAVALVHACVHMQVRYHCLLLEAEEVVVAGLWLGEIQRHWLQSLWSPEGALVSLSHQLLLQTGLPTASSCPGRLLGLKLAQQAPAGG